jgi:hypothetical protein
MVFLLRGRGAHLSDERSEEMTNGEGEAPGHAMEISNLLRLNQWFFHFPSPRVPVEYRPFRNVKCLAQ